MPSHSKQISTAPTTNNKQHCGVVKVKQKNKRKNRKKKKQRIQYPIHEMRKITNTNPMYSATAGSTSNSAKHDQIAVAQLWAKTYETMIRLQFQHRIQYWKNLAINRNAEINKLKQKLETNCKYCDEVESFADTSAKSTSQEESEESESYLKFLEITLRHRQQRKHNLDKEEDSH